MSQQVEVIRSGDKIESLNDLWSSPNPEAMGPNWRMTERIQMGLASQNPEKMAKVDSILQQRGGKLIDSSPAPEEVIKELLRKLWRERKDRMISVDGFRVVNIAGFKSLHAFDEDSPVTHCLGLDTDVIALGANPDEPSEPVGRPGNLAELIPMLGLISGRTLSIKTAAALADVRARGILAIEEVRILLKLRKFEIEEYLDTIGTGLVGMIPGAIDFSDPKSTGFLDSDFTLRVTRMNAFSENDTKKMVWVDPKVAAVVLGDYFKGFPTHLINWVIYNGLKAKYFHPFPF